MDTWIGAGYCCPQIEEGANQSEVQEWAWQIIRMMGMANCALIPPKSAPMAKLLWPLLCNIPWLLWEYNTVPRFFIGGIFQLDMARANHYSCLILYHTSNPVESKLLLGSTFLLICTATKVGVLRQSAEITFDVFECTCFWGCYLSEVIVLFWGFLLQQSS